MKHGLLANLGRALAACLLAAPAAESFKGWLAERRARYEGWLARL